MQFIAIALAAFGFEQFDEKFNLDRRRRTAGGKCAMSRSGLPRLASSTNDDGDIDGGE
jgi:hypothetical protein